MKEENLGWRWRLACVLAQICWYWDASLYLSPSSFQ